MPEHQHLFLNLPELAPHKFCLIAQPDVLWGLVVSDVIYAISYLLIPLALHWMRPAKMDLVRRVHELFPGADPKHILDMKAGMLTVFQAFILACATSHIMNAVTMFWSFYLWSLAVHLLGAAISLASAVAFLWAGWRLRQP